MIAGITNHGSTLLGPGHVRHAGKGETIIGKSDGKLSGALRDLQNVLTKAGFETKISKDIDSVIWGKLIINVGINALTAITRLNNGRLVEYEEARSILRGAVQEATKIVKRKTDKARLRRSDTEGGICLQSHGRKCFEHAAGCAEQEEDRNRFY